MTLLLVGLLACKSAKPEQQQAPQGEMPPADVGVVTVKLEQVTLQAQLAGRTTAALVADLRPQVSGIVKARLFEEGTLVKAGQVLYQIDASMYRAQLAQANADLSSASAQLGAAKTKNDRYVSLAKIEGVSKQEADDARAAVEVATSAVAQRQAALQAARINLNYSTITAPITGRIGTSSVTVGALVTAGQPQPLATIRSLDPIYVDVNESAEDRLRLRAQVDAGTLAKGNAKVKLQLADGTMYAKEGVLEFAEVAVDAATGMVTLRAKFPNPDETLLPGMYVRAVLDQAINQSAMLVPQQGVTRDAKGDAVAMVVGKDGKAEMRTITTDRAIGDKWLVSSGLVAGDKVIVEGLNKIGPGMPVKPTEVTLGAPGAPPAMGSGAPPAAGSGSGSGSAAGSNAEAAK
ncbi:MAG TPA: efflux RND transporter periplasmic adaptor subunit [Kofleriaceae bacterium]